MKKCVLALLVLLSSSVSWAWGSLGHRVVAAIAERHLCVKAQNQVIQILGGETLVEVSTWADDVRSSGQHPEWEDWHFANVDGGKTYQETKQSSKGDVVTAIESQIRALHSSNLEEQKVALKLLVHFVGDSHQPFHAGLTKDYGGNGYRVSWFGNPESLHSVWDSRILYTLNFSYSELANLLDSPIKTYPNFSMGTVLDWVNESGILAQSAYPVVKPQKAPQLGFQYYDRHVETVKRRLREGGLRLADLLNNELGC